MSNEETPPAAETPATPETPAEPRRGLTTKELVERIMRVLPAAHERADADRATMADPLDAVICHLLVAIHISEQCNWNPMQLMQIVFDLLEKVAVRHAARVLAGQLCGCPDPENPPGPPADGG